MSEHPNESEWNDVKPLQPAEDPLVRLEEGQLRLVGETSAPDNLAELTVPRETEEAKEWLKDQLFINDLTPKVGFEIHLELVMGFDLPRYNIGTVSFVSGLLPQHEEARKYQMPFEDFLLQIDERFTAPEGQSVSQDPSAAEHWVRLAHLASMVDAREEGSLHGGMLECRIGQPPTDPVARPKMNTRYFDSAARLTEYLQDSINRVGYDQDGAKFFEEFSGTGVLVPGTNHNTQVQAEWPF